MFQLYYFLSLGFPVCHAHFIHVLRVRSSGRAGEQPSLEDSKLGAGGAAAQLASPTAGQGTCVPPQGGRKAETRGCGVGWVMEIQDRSGSLRMEPVVQDLAVSEAAMSGWELILGPFV